MSIIVGITGLSGSGKDTLADILTSIAVKRGIQSICLKLSDEIREDALNSGVNFDQINRKILIRIGNHLRSTYGGGILAKRILERISTKLSLLEFGIIIITGIRNPEEVEVFQNELQEKFVLVGVEADPSVRRARKLTRKQYKEDANPSEDIDKADEDIGIKTCIEMSQIRFGNNGTKEELIEQAQELFARYISSP